MARPTGLQRFYAQADRVIVLGLILIAFTLRLYRLGFDSLWYDETVSVMLAQKPVLELINHTARDIHPPAYYLMLHGWKIVAKPTPTFGLEFLYGWPSLLFGVAAVAMLYPLGRLIIGRQVALIALGLGAINPFLIWYSQEVRMYSMGALLGLLCIWSTLKVVDTLHHDKGAPDIGGLAGYLIAYAVAGAIGLYTLYYFALLLVALNLYFLFAVWRFQRRQIRYILLPWLSAQMGLLIAWLPWAPVFWRQIMRPPVPPWRENWESIQTAVDATLEVFGTLLAGQAWTDTQVWLFGLVGVVLFLIYFGYAKSCALNRKSKATQIIAYALLVPVFLILTISVISVPIYHVRYLSVVAPVFMLVVAVALLWFLRTNVAIGIAGTSLIVAISLVSLNRSWSSPRLMSDDHRAAVNDVATGWRPGDAVLVNAGWVYPALLVYWPDELIGPHAARPPAIDLIQRLGQPLRSPSATEDIQAEFQVPIVMSGSVDGSPDLGWGLPESDFFSISSQETLAALNALSEQTSRLWHYRLYDTVSDPNGVIRSWLDESQELVRAKDYPGNSFLRGELYGTTVAAEQPEVPGIVFGDLLKIAEYPVHQTHRAGETTFIDLVLEMMREEPNERPDLALSVRLYDDAGALVAQNDEQLWPDFGEWQKGILYRQSLALPIPVSTKPGAYWMELLVYDKDSLVPLDVDDEQYTVDGQRWRMAKLDVDLPTVAPIITDTIARFDYIDLVSASVDRLKISTSSPLELELVWRPVSNEYRDNYLATVDLWSPAGELVQSWTELAGGPEYPSGRWPAGFPIREVRRLNLDPQLSQGEYELSIRLERQSDRLSIPARTRWWVPDVDKVHIATVELS